MSLATLEVAPAQAVHQATAAHLPALDAVRGLSMLMVAVYHMTFIRPTNAFESGIVFVMQGLWVSVDIFFALSSFLITGILLDSVHKPGYFKKFWARRSLRVFPLYFLIVIFSLLILPYLNHPKMSNFGRIKGDEWYYWFYLQNIPIAWGGFRHAILDVTWTLAIEEQFYLIWPFVILLVPRARLPMALAALFVISLTARMIMLGAGIHTVAAYVSTITRLEPLICGAAVALFIRDYKGAVDLNWVARLLMLFGYGICLIVMLVHGFSDWDDKIILGIPTSLIGIGAAGLVLLGYAGGKGSGFLNSKILQLSGKYSYAMYLFHLPLRGLVRDVLMPIERWPTYPGGQIVAQLIYYALSLSLTFFCAAACFHIFEQQFLRLKKYF
jgi:peptidoglycan/LPS O-acetylase OafA/YrhL